MPMLRATLGFVQTGSKNQIFLESDVSKLQYIQMSSEIRLKYFAMHLKSQITFQVLFSSFLHLHTVCLFLLFLPPHIMN